MELSPEFKKMIDEFEKSEPKRQARGLKPAKYATQIDPRALAKSEVAGPAPKLDIDLTLPIASKKVKHVFIEATFPELKGGASRQSAHGEASGTKPAIARAFKNLLKTIPKKRISVISAKISITTKIVEG
jgi:hypothetical protein